MKFLHAADIHLDSPLAGLARRAVVPEEVWRHCTRRAFSNLIDLAIAEDVAFLLIAGDLFDADWKDFSSGLFLAGEMRRLDRPCIAIRGNHDALSLVTRSLVPPPNLHMLSTRRPETFRLAEHLVAVHGQSFADRAVTQDISADYPPPVPGWFNIGLLHTSADGSAEHQTYAPCRIEALANKGYEYWALGHIHARGVRHADPPVVFPGNLQGRNPRETGAKGATLVRVEDGRVAAMEHRALDVLRWAQVGVDAAGAATMADLAIRMRIALAGARQAAEGRRLIVRVTLSGETACHAALHADPVQADADCRGAALAVGDDVYVERMEIATSAPPVQGDRDATAELHDAFVAALDDDLVVADLLRDMAELDGRLPAGIVDGVPRDAAAVRALLGDVWAIVSQALR